GATEAAAAAGAGFGDAAPGLKATFFLLVREFPDFPPACCCCCSCSFRWAARSSARFARRRARFSALSSLFSSPPWRSSSDAPRLAPPEHAAAVEEESSPPPPAATEPLTDLPDPMAPRLFCMDNCNARALAVGSVDHRTGSASSNPAPPPSPSGALNLLNV